MLVFIKYAQWAGIISFITEVKIMITFLVKFTHFTLQTKLHDPKAK